MSYARHIALAGETYSRNLGDGLIAETLAFLFHQVVPDVGIRFVDISGRKSWGETSQGPSRLGWLNTLNRRLSSAALGPLDTGLNALKWFGSRRRRYIHGVWRPVLSEVSVLVLGGGQLLMDRHLHFPLKVHGITNLAARLGLDIHVSACGVGRRWSPVGSVLLSRAISRATTVSVRDTLSLERLRRFAPRMAAEPSATLDPAIWAAEVYGAEGGTSPAHPVIGLGVLGPIEVSAHAPDGRTPARRELIQFWLEILHRLLQDGCAVEIFTNGSPTDYAFAQEIACAAGDALSMTCPVADLPATPRDLALAIRRYKAVVACRLHSNILAAAYRIPAVGIAWDAKVTAFYRDTGREPFCLSIYDADADAVVRTLARSIREGIDEVQLEGWKDRALESARIVAGSWNESPPAGVGMVNA